jgi:CreA protein
VFISVSSFNARANKTPNHKLATYAIDDPEVEGVACHYTVPERGGIAGA